MIKPTVGQVVWYWEKAPEEDDQPQAAIVTYIHDDWECVNLAIFPSQGGCGGRIGVPTKPADEAEEHKGGYWELPGTRATKPEHAPLSEKSEKSESHTTPHAKSIHHEKASHPTTHTHKGHKS